MDVLCFGVFQIRGDRRLFANLVESLKNGNQLARGEHSRLFQGAGVRPADRQFVTEQAAVKLKRALPLFEAGIQRLPEPARPHLHFTASFVFSLRSCASERDGNPRMRMKPAASFWS